MVSARYRDSRPDTHEKGPALKRTLGKAGLAAAAALTLAVTGCGLMDSGTNGEDPPAGAVAGEEEPADPALLLTSSAAALEQESLRFEMTMGDMMTMTGAADPAAEAAEMSMTVAVDEMVMEMQFIVIGTDTWMNMGELGAFFGATTPWMLVDLSRIDTDALGFQPEATDPVGASDMLQGLGEVEQVDDRTFEGVIDLTVAPGHVIDDDMLAIMGEDAATMAFTATIDDQDRLSHMTIFLPDVPELAELNIEAIEMRFFDYGAPVEITPPPADQVSEMPDEFYQMFDM
jgi:hypothetical protein